MQHCPEESARLVVMKSREVREQEALVSGVTICNPPSHFLPLVPVTPENVVQMVKKSYES